MPHEWCTLPLVRPTRYIRLLVSAKRPAKGSSSHTLQHAISYRYLQGLKEFFLELNGLERERISWAVHVMLKIKQTRRIAEIRQTAF